MTEREKRERAEFDAMLKAKIAAGEMTPEDAAIEWDYHFNGADSVQSIYGSAYIL